MIARPDTPLPWINYLGDEDLFGIISNTGGGYSFFRDPRLRRLTRFRYNNAPVDVGARYLYVRDEDGDFWCPSWQPARVPVESYRCRHGLGYTVIGSRRNGIEVETLYLVPHGKTLEAWRVRVTNVRGERASLAVFGAVEFNLWDAWEDGTNLQRTLSTGEVEIDASVIFHKTGYRERRDHFAYFACSHETEGYDTEREGFLGPYRGWDSPLAVERGRCSGSVASGWSPCGCHQVSLRLDPGETKEIVFLLGYHENPPGHKFDPPGSQTISKGSVAPVIDRYLQAERVETELEGTRKRWSELLGTMQVSTPDELVDRIVNIWNPYQCMVTFNLSRSASYFETGVGRGIGFRDSNQDLLGFVHMIPDRSRERILDLAATQLPDGGAYHQYQPLSKRGNDAIGSGFNDDPLWLVLAVAAYTKETGDLAILDEQVPFGNEPGSASELYEHLRRALGYTMERLGPHGLPLIGRADWNDCLNLNAFSEDPDVSFQTVEQREDGVAESVFIAGLFVLAAKEFAALAERHRGIEDAERARDQARRMTEAVREHGWDGAWFRRAYDYFGEPVGSDQNSEGRIFIEPQGMCALAGIGLDDGMASEALASVATHLITPHGSVLVQPAYTRYDPKLGEITSYPPGYKENGGVFCHTNPWIVIAETLLGNADEAFDHYMRINPAVREDISEIHRCEPYVYAQMIAGPDSPAPGEAKNSWLTGAAAWNYVAMTQWILGIRPEHEGLRIDPCIPPAWNGFSATRRFRNATYRIEVRRETGGRGRATELVVDGRRIDGNLVPEAAPGAVVEVEAAI